MWVCFEKQVFTLQAISSIDLVVKYNKIALYKLVTSNALSAGLDNNP